MIPSAFEYHTPASVSEAVALLQEYGWDAKILAGGQSLIPIMRYRLAAPQHLIDLNGLTDLAYIEEDDEYLRIGALTREADLDSSPLVHERYPLLADAAKVIADPLVRNMATVGGNIAHADPANDHPAVMLAYEADIVVTGSDGDRVIPITDFFVDLFTTAMEDDEILTEIRIPVPQPKSGGAYMKLERKVGDYAIVAAGAQVTLADDGTIAKAGIGLTNVGPVSLKATDAEAALVGNEPADDLLKQAAGMAADIAEPTSDLRGPAEYKKDMVRVLTLRALRRAIERAQGGN